MSDKIINNISKYYTEKVLSYGSTPQGVDWNGLESQENRFAQLLKLIENENSENYSLLDYGCGFGALLTYLKLRNKNVGYIGYDISEQMLKKAIEQHNDELTWLNKLELSLKVDYVIASGLFNVKLDQSIIDWENYIIKTLDEINSIAVKGFSFNILTAYSDQEYMKDYLYYASPEKYFKQCKLSYSKNVSLLHDYGLYEFTILVRK
jgi:SAM-dependent methyltransferase